MIKFLFLVLLAGNCYADSCDFTRAFGNYNELKAGEVSNLSGTKQGILKLSSAGVYTVALTDLGSGVEKQMYVEDYGCGFLGFPSAVGVTPHVVVTVTDKPKYVNVISRNSKNRMSCGAWNSTKDCSFRVLVW